MVAGLAGIFSAIGAIGGIIGSVLQYKASVKAEKARQRQMELEAARQKREILRQSQVARAQAISAAYNQGAEGASALQGGIYSVVASAGRNTVAVEQDKELSNRIFSANRQAALGGLIAGLGSGLSSLGGAISSNSGTITRFGNSGVNLPFFKKNRNSGAFVY